MVQSAIEGLGGKLSDVLRTASTATSSGLLGVCGTPRVVALASQPSAFVAKHPEVREARFLQRELHGGTQHSQPIRHAAAEVDGGSFGEILRRAGHLADAEAEVRTLGQHLIIEDKVIGVFQ